jgi:uncharacterized protein
VDLPLPIIDDLNRDYWDGARRHQLVLLQCAECSTWIHPPRPTCSKCRSERLGPRQASGRGRVYTWSVMHSKGNPGFDERLPYAVVVVELEEQPGLFTVGNIDCPREAIKIGMPVEVTYEEVTAEVILPQWRPVQAGAAR